MTENRWEFSRLKDIYVKILDETFEKIEDMLSESIKNILKDIELALKKGFVFENGMLIYKDEVKVKYFTNGSKIIELENPYYVKFITVVSIFPFKVRCSGNHPHVNERGEFCNGDIKTFHDFIAGFPTNLETVYVLSVYRLDDKIKKRLTQLGLM